MIQALDLHKDIEILLAVSLTRTATATMSSYLTFFVTVF